MRPPLTPADCDLRDFPRMMIDIPRLFSSEFDATTSDAAWRFGVTLWLKSFHQVPAASLPDDDVLLAKLAGLGRDTRSWKRARADALRGWVKCADGRLYHPVIAEVALECWLEKLSQRLSSGSGNATRWSVEFDPAPIQAEISACADMLRALNPKSKALVKKAVVTATKGSAPTGEGVPVGSERDPVGMPSGSQEKGREGKGLDTPLPPSGGDELDLVKQAYPRRDQRPDEVASAWAQACEAVEPARLLDAVRRYAASDEAKLAGGRGQVPHLHKWLREKRYENWLRAAENVVALVVWSGPEEVRRAVVGRIGEDYARAYVDTAKWDETARTITTRTGTGFDKLRRECGPELRALNVTVQPPPPKALNA